MRCRSHLQAGIVSRPQFGLALLLALGSGCSGSPSSETGSPSSETGCTARSVEVAQQYIDLMARGEIQEAAELSSRRPWTNDMGTHFLTDSRASYQVQTTALRPRIKSPGFSRKQSMEDTTLPE